MLVNNVMLTRDQLATVSRKTTIEEVLKVIEEHNFLSIPVVDGDKFYGVIAKDRIYEYCYENNIDKQRLSSDLIAEALISTELPTIDPLEMIEMAVEHLAKKSIPFVAVVDEHNVFKGILTHKAVFEQFVEVFGLNKGQRLAVIAFDIPGQASKLSKIIADNGGDILSFVVVDPKSVTDVKEIVLRIKSNNMERLVKKIKEAGFKVQ